MRLVLRRRRGRGRAPLELLLALLPVLIAGCVSAPPRDQPELQVEIPGRWSAAPGPPGEPAGGVAPSDESARPGGGPEWWTAFGDDRLDGLIAEALAANHDLRAAAARVEAATARARIAGAELLPQASFEYTPSRGRRNFIGFPDFGAAPGGGAASGVASTTTTVQGASLVVSWEADLWGRLRAGKAAAIAGVQASQADLAAAHLSIAGQTAKAWFALIEAGEQVVLAREILASRRETTAWIRRRYELGIRPALDLRLARVSEASADASYAARERALDAATRRVDLLLARYPDGSVDTWDPLLTLPDAPLPAPAGLPSQLVTRRPDLVAAERRLAAAGLAVKEARAALYPQLRLTGSAGRQSRELADLLHGDFSIWNLAAGLVQPLFQGGRLRAGVDLAQAGYREAAEEYVRTVLESFGEVESALVAETALARQEEALEEAASQSVAAQALAENRYAAGLDGYLSVLAAQREARLARSLLLEVRRQRLEARIDFHLALGGGFEAPPPDENGGADAVAARGRGTGLP